MKSVVCALMLTGLAGCAEHRFSDFIESFMWKERLVIITTPSITDKDFSALQHIIDTTPSAEPTTVFTIVHNTSVTMNGRLIPTIAALQFTEYFNSSPNIAEILFIGLDGTELHRTSAASASEILPQWLAQKTKP